MTTTELLNSLLERHGFSAPRKELPYPDQIILLRRLDLASVEPSTSSVLCDACDLDHTSRIISDSATDRIGWHCPEAGFVPATNADLQAVRFNPGRLVTLIADALDCRRRRSQPLIDTSLWRVGSFEYANEVVSLYLALRLHDIEAVNATSEKLSSEPGLHRGLLLTPNISGAAGISIARCRIAALEELISFEDGELVADQDRAAGLAGVEVRLSGGRPGHPRRREAETLIRARIAKGELKSSKRAEARAIKQMMGKGAPGETTLIGMITEERGDQ
ncbi:MAG: hypothetical protein AB8B85_21420 [Paracoccaceae bacterium]